MELKLTFDRFLGLMNLEKETVLQEANKNKKRGIPQYRLTQATLHGILQSLDLESIRFSSYHKPWLGPHASSQWKGAETLLDPGQPDPSPT